MLRTHVAVGGKLTLLVAMVLIGTMGSPPTGARGADVLSAPIYGDLNRDGRPDRATLVEAGPGRCGVRVELRRVGGYRPAVLHTYELPIPDDVVLRNYQPVGVFGLPVAQPSEFSHTAGTQPAGC